MRLNTHESRWPRIGPAALWFCLALTVLCPIQWMSIAESEWLWAPPKPSGDGPDYENIAYHLWQGEGFLFDNQDADWRRIYESSPHDYGSYLDEPARRLLTTGRPPLLPLVISAVYTVVGRNVWAFAAVRIVLITCVAISGGLAVRLTAELLSSLHIARNSRLQRISFWAGCLGTLALVATNRTIRDYATDFLTEPIALLLMQVFVITLYTLGTRDNKQRWRLAVGAGCTLGALILTRSMFIVWLPALWGLIALATPAGRRQRFGIATLVIVVSCLVCSPWWLRNCVVLHAWMPLGTQGSITLLGGYSDAALHSNGDWQPEPEIALRAELATRPDFQQLESDAQRELVVSQVAGARVRAWLLSHLDALPTLIAKRIYVHWNPYSGRSLLWKIAILLGVLGLMWYRDRAGYWLVGLPLISTLVVAGFYSTGGRFLVPLYGLLFTLAGLGIAFAVDSLLWLCPALKPLRKQETSASGRDNDAQD